MSNKAQKIRVGLFVVVTATLLGLVLVVFGGIRFWQDRTPYFVEVTDTVYGLEKGAKVYFGGIPVGTVTDIAVSPDALHRVVVRVEVDRGTPVHADTRAILQNAGITGLREVDLRGGTPEAPMLLAGGVIPQGESTFDELERHAKRIADRSDELLARAQKIVDNLATLTEPGDYQEILRDARVTADNLAATSATMRAMVGENRVAIRRSIDAVHAAAQSTSTLLDNQIAELLGEATTVVTDLKALVHDNGGTLKAAVADLRTASRSFRDLAREVRQRPSRLLYGKAAADRKLP